MSRPHYCALIYYHTVYCGGRYMSRPYTEPYFDKI